MALAARRRGLPFRTWVMLGDGELQEGQVWKAAFAASRYRLDTLTAIVDENGLPQFGWPDADGFTRERPYDDPAAKFAAFGWHVVACDGHDHDAIRTASDAAVAHLGAPTCVVARTVKGQGISFMEGDFNWYAQVPSGDDLTMALAAIDRRLSGEDERPAR